MDELQDLVALSVPAASRVLAVGPESPLLARLAARNCQTSSVAADDTDRLDLAQAFPDTDFDAVVLMGTLAYTVFPAELLRRVAKLLGTDGVVVASVPNATHAARRLRVWEGTGHDEEVGPGRSLLRSFDRAGIDRLLSENGLRPTSTVGVRRVAVLGNSALPPAVRDFLTADAEADTDHYVVVASPSAGPGAAVPSLAEALQHRVHEAEDRLSERNAELTTLEEELDALRLDLAIKDDFALELRGSLRTAEVRADRLEAELADARVWVTRAEQQFAAQAGELDDLRRASRRRLALVILDRIGRRLAPRH